MEGVGAVIGSALQPSTVFYGLPAGFGGDFTVVGSMKV